MSWQVKSPAPPSGYRYGPAYRPSRANVVRGIAYILLGRPRFLARDAFLAIPDMPLPPIVRGAEAIPEHGPFVVVANHYERPGLWMVWPALLVGQAVWERTGLDTHWVAIEEWESFAVRGIPVPRALIRQVFLRAFATYGIVAMPSALAPTSARAGAIRAAAGRIKRGEIVGLMPEGDVGSTPELLPAREGVGSFLLILAGGGVPVLPVGLYEEGDRLVAHFGPAFELKAPPEAREDRDRWARDQVMTAIRSLLPEPLWGVYRP